MISLSIQRNIALYLQIFFFLSITSLILLWVVMGLSIYSTGNYNDGYGFIYTLILVPFGIFSCGRIRRMIDGVYDNRPISIRVYSGIIAIFTYVYLLFECTFSYLSLWQSSEMLSNLITFTCLILIILAFAGYFSVVFPLWILVYYLITGFLYLLLGTNDLDNLYENFITVLKWEQTGMNFHFILAFSLIMLYFSEKRK